MSDLLYPVKAEVEKSAWIDREKYLKLYQQSIDNPVEFWSTHANNELEWIEPFSENAQDIMSFDYERGEISWFKDGVINVTINCIDRHLESHAQKVAIIWEGDEPDQSLHITYQELHDEVAKMANILKTRDIKKGDRVAIYMPMIPEAAYAMLACARIGAVHTVVFGGFSPNSLRDRILDCDCSAVITADEGVRGAKIIPLKSNVEAALEKCPNVHTTLVIKRTGNAVPENLSRDVWLHEQVDLVSKVCDPEPMGSEDPLFILYTSGSTGKPKGVLHTTAGYLLYAAMTHKYIFDYQVGDIYWCTADVGWITGHSYIVYGPLANAATTLMFEGVPTYPDASRFWSIIDKHNVNIFYTAPTALRALMGLGDEFVKNASRKSLKLLGTVGEPINPEAWKWYYDVVGDSQCPIVDTWWQTETGGILVSPLPGATDLKPGSATKPFFGIQLAILDENANEVIGEGEGSLVLKHSWPGQMRGVYGDQERFISTYFSQFPGYYFSGDGARRDKDGDYWITGRIDDVINVSGHRIGSAEVESALVLHASVAEAAVVGVEHSVKGQDIYAFITLMSGVEPTDDLKKDLNEFVRNEIGPIANIGFIQWAPALPKTRSGKIMRRILRKIAHGDFENLGDTTTLAEPSVVDDLIKQKQ